MGYGGKYRKHIPLALVGVLLMVCLGVWVAVYTQTPRGLLTIAVLNVGQGDAIYVESPTGVQVVIDGGPDSSILRQLPTVMPFFDRSIDALVETHPHADHIAGFVDLPPRYSIGAFVEPGVVYPNATEGVLEKEIDTEHVPRYLARRGMVLSLGGGVELTILYPDHDVTQLPESRVHEGNVVARLTYGKTSMLLMGDAPKDVEEKLEQLDGVGLASDVLKVGHHGSRTSSGDAFVAMVHPRMAVISVGARNLYRLPNQEPIDTLTKYGAQVLRTDKDGTVVFRSDGHSVWLVGK